MKTAKLFKHGGSQAVRLPKEYRFEGTEVVIEKEGDAIILRPKPSLDTLADLAGHMAEHRADGGVFPDREQPKLQQERDLRLEA